MTSTHPSGTVGQINRSQLPDAIASGFGKRKNLDGVVPWIAICLVQQ